MKKPLAAALLIAATVTALAMPAGAATTPKPKKHLVAAVPCSGTSHSKAAKLWSLPDGTWAAKNPCKLWLLVGFSDPSGGDSGAFGLNVAPHTYNARWRVGAPQVNVTLRSTPDHCGASWDIGQDGKMRNTSGDPGAPGC